MNNTDILEEKEKKAIEYFENKIKNKLPLYKETYVDGKPYRINILQLETNFTEEQANKTEIILKLISNLIAENKELKEKIKEINEEYNAEQKHEMENTIPKSKVKEEIDGKFKEAKGLYERGVQPQAQYTMKLLRDLEQSLLGKE